MVNGLPVWSGNWKEHDWKIGTQDVWGIGMSIDLSEWVKNIKIFMYHVNAHHRVTSAEEIFNNQVIG